jgi:hypothetical protein
MPKIHVGKAARLNVEIEADLNAADFYVELPATFEFPNPSSKQDRID